MEPISLYLHFPFCRKKCAYCDFASYPHLEELMPEYCGLMIREMEAQSLLYGAPKAATLFLGGGTPSLVPSELMARVLKAAAHFFAPVPGLEASCECNPGTVTPEFLRMLMESGINRLSIGAQAKQGRLLNALGRIHSWEDVVSSFDLARDAGFQNLSLDLMLGLPGQTPADWLETLEAALALRPTHLSCYGLILEEGTLLHSLFVKGKLDLPDEDAERRMYDTALRVLEGAGFRQYEISNFALPGWECRHNTAYWTQKHYLGLGAAAHSMMPILNGEAGAYRRFGNTPDVPAYLEGAKRGQVPLAEDSVVSASEARFEMLMLGLRMNKGVSRGDFFQRHGRTLEDCWGEKITLLTKKGLLQWKGDSLCLTRRGMDIQNAVLLELMEEI